MTNSSAPPALVGEVPSLHVGAVSQATAAAAREEVEAYFLADRGHRWSQTENDGRARPERTTLNFGWDFRELEQHRRAWIEPPPALRRLRDEVHSLFASVSVDIKRGASSEELNQFIVTRYLPGDGVVPHFDRDKDNSKNLSYHFGESVFGVVLLPDSLGRISWQRGQDAVQKGSLRWDELKPMIELEEAVGARL